MLYKTEILELWQNLREHGELSYIEAKKAQQEIGDSVMQTICAFANSGEGYVLLGVSEPDDEHDEYWLSGVKNIDEVLDQIHNNCRNQFNVTVSIDAGQIHIDGKTLVVIKVFELEKASKPCHFIGSNKKNHKKTGVWLRGVNGDYEATLEELQPILLAKTGTNFEQMLLPNCSLDDIEPKHLQRYRNLRAKIKPNATELDYDDVELMLALDVATQKDGQVYPNIAGLLLFGTDKALRRLMPMARVDYIRHAGTVWVDSDEQRFLYTNDLREAIITIIPKLEASVIDDLPKHFHLPENSLQRADTPILPQKVVREAIVNMLMHRDYAVNQPSQINRFSDRIEFTNAGYSLKPVEKILEGEKGSQLRNPIIAQVLYDLTFAETKGSGITVMNRGLKTAGLSPVIFKSNRQHNQSETVLRLQKLIAETDMAWLSRFETLSDHEAEVLILAKKKSVISNKDIRENIGIDMHEASKILRKFCKNDYLIQHGKGTSTHYTLREHLVNHIKDTGFNTLNLPINEPSLPINEPSLPINEPSLPINEPSLPINESSLPINALVIDQLSDLPSLERSLLLSMSTEFIAGRKRLPRQEMYLLIAKLCQHRYLTANMLADLIHRETDTMRGYLSDMAKAGQLTLAYPEQITHPRQAYRTT